MLSSEVTDTIENHSRFMTWWSKQPLLTKLIIHQVWMICLTVWLFYRFHVVQEFRATSSAFHVSAGIIIGIEIFLAFANFIGTSRPLIERTKEVTVLSLTFLGAIFSTVSLYTNGLSFEHVVTVIAIPLACLWVLKHAKIRFNYHASYWVRDDGANKNHILIALATQFIVTLTFLLCLPGTFNNI